MFKKKQPTLKSLIGLGTHIMGDISFADGLRIEGNISGNVNGSQGQATILMVAESAHVQGEVHADHVVINGKVTGPVHARVMLELQPNAQIVGDVFYKALEMHQGAIITGQLQPLGVTLATDVKTTVSKEAMTIKDKDKDKDKDKEKKDVVTDVVAVVKK